MVESDEIADLLGGLGGNLRVHGVRDTRLIEKAIRERWPITYEMKLAVLNRQVRTAIDPSKSDRDAAHAARTIALMEKQNNDLLLKIIDKLIPDHKPAADSSETNELRQLLAELRTNDDWIDAQRAIAVGGSDLAGPHGASGIAGPLADGAPLAPS